MKTLIAYGTRYGATERSAKVLGDELSKTYGHEALVLDAGKVTVTEVRMSPDLRQATAYVIALGGKDMEDILPALNHNASVFQKEINAKSELKFTPKVIFKIDDSFDNAQKLDSILSNLHYSDQE